MDLVERRDDRIEEREQRLRRHMTIWIGAELLGLEEREIEKEAK